MPTPLRLDFTMQGMACVPERYPPMLDAILLAAACAGRTKPLPFSREELPVEAIDSNDAYGGFFWLTSAVQIAFTGPCSARHIYRNARPLQAFDHSHQLTSTRVYLDRGATRTVPVRLNLRQATHATAYCICTDPSQLLELAQQITHVGALGHHGHGQITSVSATEDPEALKKAWLRPIPAPCKKDPYAKTRIAVQGQHTPPYWDRRLEMAHWPTEIVL